MAGGNGVSQQPRVQWPFAAGIMAEQIRRFDWSSTPLGPLDGWPESLRSAMDIMLGCAFPATLQWGPDLVLFYNDAYVPLIGSRHPSALGKPILETFPEIAPTYAPLAERVLKGEQILLNDLLFRYAVHETMEDRWYDLSYSPVRDAEGAVAGLLAIGLDTTSKVLAEKARSSADDRLRRVLETEAVGVIFFDYTGTIVDANEVFLKMVGYSRADIEARTLNWRMLTPLEWVKVSEEQMEKMAKTGRIGPYEKEYLLKDGSRRFMLFAGRDLGDGTIAEYAIDITARKLAEFTLLRTEKLATLGRLAASIAHEINNPLEATTNLIYLAQNSAGLPADTRAYLDSASAELQRVAHIARQSLGFYREASVPAEVSVTALLDATIDLLRGKILLKDVRIDRQWKGDVKIRAVSGELRQIFSNLLANSLDALDPGGEIVIRVRQVGSAGAPRIRVTILDRGRGIPREIQSKIFEPFFSTKGDLGTGLGLWVTKQLVDNHRGSIRMRSCNEAPVTGTAFSVTLPVSAA